MSCLKLYTECCMHGHISELELSLGSAKNHLCDSQLSFFQVPLWPLRCQGLLLVLPWVAMSVFWTDLRLRTSPEYSNSFSLSLNLPDACGEEVQWMPSGSDIHMLPYLILTCEWAHLQVTPRGFLACPRSPCVSGGLRSEPGFSDSQAPLF